MNIFVVVVLDAFVCVCMTFYLFILLNFFVDFYAASKKEGKTHIFRSVFILNISFLFFFCYFVDFWRGTVVARR